MQTYKNYQQCTTILTDNNKYLSVRCTYFPMHCEVFTHPESKTKPVIISSISI